MNVCLEHNVLSVATGQKCLLMYYYFTSEYSFYYWSAAYMNSLVQERVQKKNRDIILDFCTTQILILLI
jgi:hypothetical protein